MRMFPIMALAAIGCVSAPSTNPTVLWLESTDDINAFLVASEPPPF